jgi:hypothetical protein
MTAPAKKDSSPKWKFTFPDSVRRTLSDPKSIVLRELNEDQMEQAARIGKGDNRRVGIESVKLSLYKVDDKLIDHGADEASAYWDRWSAKIKFQTLDAWGKLHQTSKEEDKAFFDSMEAVT